jgi:Flp pilus assembly protein TadD
MRNQLLRGTSLILGLAALSACSSLADPQAKLAPEPQAPQPEQQAAAGPASAPMPVSEPALADYEKGKAALQKGDVGKAIEHFLRAHRKDPDSLAGINALAVAYDMVGRPDLSDRYFKKALALAPKDPDVLNNVGYAYLRRGEDETAQRYLNEAKAIAAGNEVIIANIALLENRPEPVSDTPQALPEEAQTAALPRAYVAKLSNKSQMIVTDPTPEVAAFRPSPEEGAPVNDEGPVAEAPPAVAEEPLRTQEASLPEAAAAEEAQPLSALTDAGRELAAAKPLVPGEDEILPPGAAPSVKPDALSRLLGSPLSESFAKRPSRKHELSKLLGEPMSDGLVERMHEELEPASAPQEAVRAVPVEAVSLVPLTAAAAPAGEPAERAESVASVINDAKDCDLSLGEAKVTLVNGNGREGMARRTRGFLKLEGLMTARLLNADRYNYRNSTIRYRAEARCTAERLAVIFDGLPDMVPDDSLPEDLRVLLGGDLLGFDSMVASNQTK